MGARNVSFLWRQSILGPVVLGLGCHAPDVLVTQTDAGSDADDAIDPTVEMHEAAQALAVAECANQARCEPLLFGVIWGDQATCVTGTTALREKRAFGLGTTPAHAAQRKACAAAISGLDCEAWAHESFDNEPRPECRLFGTLPDGASCSWSSQCVHGACSAAVSPVAGCGVCVPQQPEGGPCFEPLGCEPGLTCRLVGTTARCVRLRARGEPCGAEAPCLGSNTCRDGTCAAPLSLGDPCAPSAVDEPCGPFWRAATCNTKTLRCEAAHVALAGDPCGIDDDGVITFCAHGSVCKTLTDTRGTCVLATADGRACGGAYLFRPDDCLEPSTCNGAFEASCGIGDSTHCTTPAVPP
jgi:hypothetical protein